MMTRRTVFQMMMAATTGGREAMAMSDTFSAKRVIREHTGTFDAPAGKVFPLLCPVEEYKWISEWECQMVYSDSGVAEDNCIFTTNFPGAGPQIWNVSHYQPNERIEFVVVNPASHVMRLNIAVSERARRTTLRWTRMFTGLTEAGNRRVEAFTEAAHAELMAHLDDSLAYYLKTGAMLRPGPRQTPSR